MQGSLLNIENNADRSNAGDDLRKRLSGLFMLMGLSLIRGIHHILWWHPLLYFHKLRIAILSCMSHDSYKSRAANSCCIITLILQVQGFKQLPFMIQAFSAFYTFNFVSFIGVGRVVRNSIIERSSVSLFVAWIETEKKKVAINVR
ncbi:hypothetical protein WN943_020384 [Citrus x changshan-huyou]